jgi:hypothetical protein
VRGIIPEVLENASRVPEINPGGSERANKVLVVTLGARNALTLCVEVPAFRSPSFIRRPFELHRSKLSGDTVIEL